MTFGEKETKKLKDWWAYGDNIAMGKAFAYEDVKEAVLEFEKKLKEIQKAHEKSFIPENNLVGKAYYSRVILEFRKIFGDFEK